MTRLPTPHPFPSSGTAHPAAALPTQQAGQVGRVGLAGRVGDLLSARLEGLPTEEVDVWCAHQSLGAALMAAVETLHRAPAVMVTEPNYTTNPGFESKRIYYPLDDVADRVGDKVLVNGTPVEPGRVATLSFDDTAETIWQRTFLTATTAVGQAMRRERLAEGLRRAMVLKHTVTERLHLPYPVGVADITRWADQCGALLVWWQARRTQGYDPQTAATMLALVCHPSVYAKVTFTDGDGPPVLAPPLD